MRRPYILLLIFIVACGPSKRGIFGEKRSAHEKYGDRIKEAGLDKTQLGIRWFSAAQNSLVNPLAINLPHKETGYFSADEPRAAGYVFDGKRGSRLNIDVSIIPSDSLSLFVELWRPEDGKIKLMTATDSTLKMNYEIEKDGPYILRIQPPLLEAMEYTLIINTGPSLAFPVSASGDPKMISFWRDPRDMGARSHEGVDIRVKFRTPAVAAADGHVQRVTDNRLGGKVVFFRPQGKNYALYYAHLDSQTVTTGQHLKAGETLGLVGTTGNARGTPPHLHFGIYAIGGAVDPFPFINQKIIEPADITISTDHIGKWSRASATVEMLSGPYTKATSVNKVQANEVMRILSATGTYYKVALPNGIEGFIAGRYVSVKALRTQKADSTMRLLDQPSVAAAARAIIRPASTVNILGSYGGFYLAEQNNVTGWIGK